MKRTAKSIQELLSKTNKRTLARARSLNPRLINQRGSELIYEVSGTEKYKIEVKVDNTDVYVRCSCNSFVYQGSEYHAHKQNYLLGSARGNLEEPIIRDPKSENLVCKHIVAVFDDMLGTVVKRVAFRYFFDT